MATYYLLYLGPYLFFSHLRYFITVVDLHRDETLTSLLDVFLMLLSCAIILELMCNIKCDLFFKYMHPSEKRMSQKFDFVLDTLIEVNVNRLVIASRTIDY